MRLTESDGVLQHAGVRLSVRAGSVWARQAERLGGSDQEQPIVRTLLSAILALTVSDAAMDDLTRGAVVYPGWHEGSWKRVETVADRVYLRRLPGSLDWLPIATALAPVLSSSRASERGLAAPSSPVFPWVRRDCPTSLRSRLAVRIAHAAGGSRPRCSVRYQSRATSAARPVGLGLEAPDVRVRASSVCRRIYGIS